MLLIFRVGSQIPVPGMDRDVLAQTFDSETGLFALFNLFSGGAFSQFTIFALSITPYITASIILQLLTIAIPSLERLAREGVEGRKKIAAYTRYLTVVLAIIQAIGVSIGLFRQALISTDFFSVAVIVLVLTAGTTFLMWLGEQITEKGVGNGISIVLVINIISRIPADMGGLWDQFIANKGILQGVIAAVVILAIIIGMVVFVIILQGAQRKIPVQYSKKMQGRKQVGGQQTHIPLKVNTSGVIPVIFAQSLMQTPVILASLFGWNGGTGFWDKVLNGLNQANWCNPEEPLYTIGLLVYIGFIIGFAYFYTQISFNPMEIANNMKKAGGFIPGMRPGKTTSDYLDQVLKYIVFIGAIGLTIIAIVPIFFSGVFSANVSFAGTSLIIVVGVVIETLKQIESQMRVRYYKGFLND